MFFRFEHSNPVKKPIKRARAKHPTKPRHFSVSASSMSLPPTATKKRLIISKQNLKKSQHLMLKQQIEFMHVFKPVEIPNKQIKNMLQQMKETHLNRNNKFPEKFKCFSMLNFQIAQAKSRVLKLNHQVYGWTANLPKKRVQFSEFPGQKSPNAFHGFFRPKAEAGSYTLPVVSLPMNSDQKHHTRLTCFCRRYLLPLGTDSYLGKAITSKHYCRGYSTSRTLWELS